MSVYKNITYYKLLKETLGSYFSVNSSGELSYLYKLCLCCLYPLQTTFENYQRWRIKQQIVAYCKYEVGQLTNVLNYLYDTELQRIYISQSAVKYIYVPPITEESIIYTDSIDAAPLTPLDTLYANVSYLVISGHATYDGVKRSTGMTFIASSTPNFSTDDGGTLCCITSAPVITDEITQGKVYINIPSDLSGSLTDILSTINQIIPDGLTYNYQLI